MSVRRQKLQKWLIGVLAFAAILAVALSAVAPTQGSTAGAGASGPVAAFVRFMDATPSAPVFLLLLILAGIPTTLVHELGHAWMARRRLATEVLVRVGDTGRLGTIRLGALAAEVNTIAMPGRVAGSAEFSDERATRHDVALIALAGPAASLAQFVVCGWAWSATPDGLLRTLLWGMTATGAVGALVNLIPMTLSEKGSDRVVRSDGRVALDAVRGV